MDEIYEANRSLLESMLLDEQKLITYVSLSKDLCVHVNTSKQLLAHLVNTTRQERPDLQVNVNYIISGATQNNNAQTLICSEKDLSKQKSYFTNIFFEHIYSVNLGFSGIDTAAYLLVNKFEDFVFCSGLIKSNLCDKRTSAEIGNLKTNSQEIVVPEKSKSLPLRKVVQEIDTNKNGHSVINTKSKQKESKSEPVVKQELEEADLPKKEAVVSNRPKVITTSINQKTQKGISGFFNKSVKKEVVKKEDKVHNGDTTVESVKSTEKLENVHVMEQSSETVKVEDLSKKEFKTNKILSQIKKTSKVDKKRKRLLHVSDSDSENENNDPFTDNSVTEQEQVITHESDDEIPPTPTANNIKITSGMVNPKKRRKIVDKTYTDEDGYFLTKKEEVYESCSENEDEVKSLENPPKKQIKIEISPTSKTTGSKKKVSPPQKGKQPPLTNFFKKL